jgi:hypothetical protein
VKRAAVYACAACAAALACDGPPALPLTAEDFSLRGVPMESDSTEIRLSFGEPDSIVTSESPFGSDAPLVTWIYRGFEVRFAGELTPVGYLIHAPGERTMRGLQVGDPARTVLALYGTPGTRVESAWTYIDASDDSGLQVIDLIVRNDTVRRIYLGRALD